MKSLVFFNNKGGVGKTTLTFNVAHMISRLGFRVVAVDLDPQCNLTAMMLREDELIELWERSSDPGRTVAACLAPVQRGRGDVHQPTLRAVTNPELFAPSLWLLPGDLSFSRFEQPLAADGWGRVDGGDERAIDVVTSIERLMRMAATQQRADIVIADVGPSLGAINHAVLISCDAVVIPVAPDLFSLQGLRNVGPTLREWRDHWSALVKRVGSRFPDLPEHAMEVIGYVVQQHLARSDRPVEGYAEWIGKIPSVFHEYVLGAALDEPVTIEQDESRISLLKHFSSLVPIAQAARKPLFDLRAAEGIGGGQLQAVSRARKDFEALSHVILRRLGVTPPDSPTQS